MEETKANEAAVAAANGGADSSSSSSLLLLTSNLKPKTQRVMRGISPPPFLTKLYNMVDDPRTNSIISWSSNGDSFIILDSYKLCFEIFPNCFRHHNISSFIYQLNNYGFKKISWEQSEYAHRCFQEGKKELLKNIKRRDQPQVASSKIVSSPDHSDELIILRNEHLELKELVGNLEMEQKKMDEDLTCVKARIESCVSKQENMLKLFTNKFTPSFLSQLKEKSEMNGQAHGDQETSKRQKLDVGGSTDVAVDRMNKEKNAMLKKEMEFGKLNCEFEGWNWEYIIKQLMED